MRRDFILSMIDQLGDVLAKILQLQRSGEPAEAQICIDQAVRVATGFERDFIERITPESLVSLMVTDKPGESWLEPCSILVRLLHEQAAVHTAMGRSEAAIAANLKALYLLMVIQKKAEGAALPTITPGIPELIKDIPTKQLPVFLQTAIARLRNEPHP